jgi:hypothetical protein
MSNRPPNSQNGTSQEPQTITSHDSNEQEGVTRLQPTKSLDNLIASAEIRPMNFDEAPWTSGSMDFMQSLEPGMLEKFEFPTGDAGRAQTLPALAEESARGRKGDSETTPSTKNDAESTSRRSTQKQVDRGQTLPPRLLNMNPKQWN